MVTQPQTSNEVVYPESDGKPMADNTKQFRWIVVIEQNLELLFADDPNVFVAGDLLWYPVEGNNRLCTAPDAMVAFGRPKGDRGSYLQWREDNIPPQVVFEILSPGNTAREMSRKLMFYSTYGVEEYYLYDPDRNRLEGWCRSDDPWLEQIESIEGWISPRLGIRFELGEELNLYRPDGVPFFSFAQLNQMLDQERQRAEQEKQRADDMEALLRQYRDRFGEIDQE
ncbi:Uma2 family endonuclease [Leptolyngbya sp. NIES-2104]|uniref:Uma2 family endonuclease n=1 Tax=Leptolyngbya sp. NIES-2104 TaxID=1552121 RepID=UPI00073E3A07|nr:Uma2 family endonuclease [Leptolyngbya sp. NIES-2104]